MVLSSQTILKIDQWHTSTSDSNREVEMLTTTPVSATLEPPKIEGAFNFRRIPHTHIYGVAQPNFAGIKNVLMAVATNHKRHTKAIWINLREEPLVYINGIPYVLRFNNITIRNIKQYSGITPSRLELLESRLKDDVLAEIARYDGKILLHLETSDGRVVPTWEEVDAENVLTVREVMDSVVEEVIAEVTEQGQEPLQRLESVSYYRVSVTAETMPEIKEFDDLRLIIGNLDLGNTGIIL